RSSSRCRDTQSDMDPRIRASVDRLSTPRKVRENAVPKINANNVAPAIKTTSNLALFNPSANRVAEKIRRRSQQIQAQPEEPPKESKSVRLRAREPSLIPKIRSSSIQRPASAAAKEKNQPTQPQQTIAFTRNLRSYKTPTGTTPVKPLTKPNPFPFRRSSSRCRDTQSDMDPRIRASVDRLSTPRKVRENAVPK
uniref:Uncharacterized protein n=1 Tax=Panagrolaimus sp. ES5 TaxID=591445 RepID=A0AC34G017_9BILA